MRTTNVGKNQDIELFFN